MKLGLIGVGPWGSLLGRKAVSCGATIVAHARASQQPSPEFGKLISIDEILNPSLVGGVIIASGPEINIETTLKAASLGIPLIATKPLRVETDVQLRAPLFVDFVRLWSKSYKALRSAINPDDIDFIQVFFSGPGPLRSFSGVEDYGSHALAFIHDLLPGSINIARSEITRNPNGSEKCVVSGTIRGRRINVLTGNGSESHQRHLLVRLQDGTRLEYEEGKPTTCFKVDGEIAFSENNQDPVSTMIETFLRQSRIGWIDTRWLNLAQEVQTSLRKIRSASEKHP